MTIRYFIAFVLFVAGLREENARLMQRALDDHHDPKHHRWYEGYGLPKDPNKLRRLVEAVREVAAARRKVKGLADWLISGEDMLSER